MKPRTFNSCNIYLFIILLTSLKGTLYTPSGFISVGLQYVLILVSLYYVVYANLNYKLPEYFRALNVLLVLFTIYGLWFLLSGERVVLMTTYAATSSTQYLKSIYLSLLPIYPFYVFAKQGLLKESTIKIWFFVFLILAIRRYYRNEDRNLEEAIARGSSREEFTNNAGYAFVALMPAVVLFYKKPIIQYLLLVVCIGFIVMAVKRGAILIGVICFVWFVVVNAKKASKKNKWIIAILGVTVLFAVFYLFKYMMETSDLFRFRYEITLAGESSGRDEIARVLMSHFLNEHNPIRLVFGNGANATVNIVGNYAHNDWLEILINQGILGLIIYLVYWYSFFVSWQRLKKHPMSFMAVGMILVAFFLSSLFSMSYNAVSRCSAMLLGYFLATSYNVGNAQQDQQTIG